MRKFLIGGNWKMHKGIKETEEFADELLISEFENDKVDVFIAPPFTSIYAAVNAFKNSNIRVGAQNVSWKEKGAYTGEISPLFLKELGVECVIIGHSERRHIFKETDEIIREKIKIALRNELKVVICIGETEEQRDAGEEKEIVRKQLTEDLDGIEVDSEMFSIAYEPVWAIGTGKTAKLSDAEDMHRIIRDLLGKEGENIRIMYGGSVKPHNALELLEQENIDGALIGGASLDPLKFSEIIKIARGIAC